MFPIRIVHRNGHLEDRYVEKLDPVIFAYELQRLRLTEESDTTAVNFRPLTARRQTDMATRLPTYIIE